jgi:antirestriction protein ArdC
MENKERGDFYKEVTNKIIAALENNTRPWVQPWNGGILPIPMRHNNRLYQGIIPIVINNSINGSNFYG